MNHRFCQQLMAILSSLMLTSLSTYCSAQNLLENPGFEDDVAPALSSWDTTGPDSAFATSTAYARSGQNSLLIDSTDAGQWSSPNVGQVVPASPGDVFNLSGYLLAPEPGIPAGDASFGLFKLVFQDADGNDLVPAAADVGIINTDFPGVESQPFLNADSVANTWQFSEAQGTAPDNTAQALFLALNVNQNANGMYFDDISATLVPEPASVTLLAWALLTMLACVRKRHR